MGYFNEYEEIINDGYHTYVEEELDQEEMYYDEVVKGIEKDMKKIDELEVKMEEVVQHPCMYDVIRKAKGTIGREMTCEDCVNYSNCKWVEKGINDPEDCDDYEEELED